MAQDVQQYFPSLVSHQEENDFYTMDYSGFGILYIKAIQELNSRIETQEEIILKQNSLMDNLVKRIELLEEK